MKKGVYLSICILILSLSFISASHVITTSSGGNNYTLNKGINYIYYIQITNNDIGINSSILEVNVTLPNSFVFISETNNTNAPFKRFYNTTNVLTWNNFTGYLINGNDFKYFEFKAASSTPGNYTMTITTLNSTRQYSSDLFVTVLEICSPTWNCTEWSICTNRTQKRNCTDLNNCGDELEKPPVVQICNITNTTINHSAICISDWTCTVWSDCMNGKQIRSCVDSNTCANDSNKPGEEQDCISLCNPVWECTMWQPIVCSKDKTQTRICSDSNNCNYGEKPEEIRGCKRDAILLFIISIVVILTFIIIISIIILEEWWAQNKKKGYEEETSNKGAIEKIQKV